MTGPNDHVDQVRDAGHGVRLHPKCSPMFALHVRLAIVGARALAARANAFSGKTSISTRTSANMFARVRLVRRRPL